MIDFDLYINLIGIVFVLGMVVKLKLTLERFTRR